jgi:hypothetical protein
MDTDRLLLMDFSNARTHFWPSYCATETFRDVSRAVNTIDWPGRGSGVSATAATLSKTFYVSTNQACYFSSHWQPGGPLAVDAADIRNLDTATGDYGSNRQHVSSSRSQSAWLPG